MANNYSSASFVIPVKDAERTRTRLEAIAAFIEGEYNTEDGRAGWPAEIAVLFGDKAEDIADMLDARRVEHEYLGFAWSIDGQELGLYHDESIDMEAAVLVAQILLDLDDNDTTFTATWADTCSKPRTDEFGGGAVAFNRHSTEWANTYDMARELAAKLDTEAHAPDCASRFVGAAECTCGKAERDAEREGN